jgi:hypothetical protein
MLLVKRVPVQSAVRNQNEHGNAYGAGHSIDLLPSQFVEELGAVAHNPFDYLAAFHGGEFAPPFSDVVLGVYAVDGAGVFGAFGMRWHFNLLR